MGTDEKKRNNANRQKAWYATQIGKGANATEGFKLKIETAKFNCQTRREMRDFCDQGKEMFLAEFDASMCPSAEKSQDKYSREDLPVVALDYRAHVGSGRAHVDGGSI